MGVDTELATLWRKVQDLERQLGMLAEAPGRTQAFTPVLRQGGTIALAVGSFGYEMLIGNLYVVSFACISAAAGTSSNSIRVEGFSRSFNLISVACGAFHIQDPGVSNYAGSCYAIAGHQIAFIAHNNGDLFGLAPAYTVSSGDTISGVVINRVV